MGTWNSRGLRGSTLEEMVNWTNDHYLEKGLALIQKIPTPITPVRMDADHKQITLAYFEKRSTVDYIGAVQGIPVCFDAKECVRFEEMIRFWNRACDGGRKSIRYEELDPRFFMKPKNGYYIPYLDFINLDLELREEA